MVVVNDVMKLIVIKVPKVKLINVKPMVVVNDVMNLIVIKVPKVKPISVLPMVVVNDVLIVLIGLIVVVVHRNMMVIVLHVSKDYFQTMSVVRKNMLIQKN